ncbi:CS012 protein, partial [Donacobius atricapilla]|nr:CS012 protein [Donacobius atricapilla]
LGGAVGGFVAWMTSEEFKPVPQILMELPAAEKQRLCAQVTAVVRNLNWTDARQMISLVMANSTLRERMFGVLTNYVTNELGAQITYRV